MARAASRHTVVLGARRKAKLEAIVRRASSPQSLVRRARIALLAHAGASNAEIARRVGCAVATVRTWRRRFVRGGMPALLDRVRSGRPPVYGSEVRLKVVAAATSVPRRRPRSEPCPACCASWSTPGSPPQLRGGGERRGGRGRVMMRRPDPPRTAISRAPGGPGASGAAGVRIHPQRHRLHRRCAAGRHRAGDRRADQPQRLGHLHRLPAPPRPIHRPAPEHPHRDGQRAVAHLHPTKAWLAAHPRSASPTPKHASWLDMAELWFSVLTRGLLRRGEFISRTDLAEKITNFAIRYNRTAKPWKSGLRRAHRPRALSGPPQQRQPRRDRPRTGYRPRPPTSRMKRSTPFPRNPSRTSAALH